jgi:hypothetical protein
MKILDKFYQNIDFFARLTWRSQSSDIYNNSEGGTETQIYDKTKHSNAITQLCSMMIICIIPIGILTQLFEKNQVTQGIVYVFAGLLVFSVIYLMISTKINLDKQYNSKHADIKNFLKWIDTQSKWKEYKFNPKTEAERLESIDANIAYPMAEKVGMSSDIYTDSEPNKCIRISELALTHYESAGGEQKIYDDFEGTRIEMKTSMSFNDVMPGRKGRKFIIAYTDKQVKEVRIDETSRKLVTADVEYDTQQLLSRIYNDFSELHKNITKSEIGPATSLRVVISLDNSTITAWLPEVIYTRMSSMDKLKATEEWLERTIF